ncbi:YqaA family protein [Phreatobacter stygius]|uniref:DedA family protein n=1 Tax=Phreatobacter stygius TaxID=1940610 RepID=A0A4D7B2P8_9HYPH|nr:VTT domain-containing protein [Phreatobacter stygius]QCI65565.1 DedA family protein [Phreatobacter stygius]
MLADLATLTTMAFAAFSAATLLPGGSELVFVGFLAAGYQHPLALFLVATSANIAGGLTNWWIGTLIARGADSQAGHAWLERFKLPPDMIDRVERLFGRFGWAALLLCWVPVIGDPITLVAGMARYPLLPTAVLTGIARMLRYALIWLTAAGLLGALGG